LFRSATGLDLNFAGGAFSLNNTRTDSPANIPGWSFSRTDTNGIATALDLAGNVIQFATGVPRITNRGILVEEARTNGIRNSVAAGAVVGTPGTLPTNWTTFSGSNGLSPQIVAVGTDSVTGTGFVEVRFSGTTVNNTGSQIKFEGGIAATNAQAWTASVYAALVAGSVSGFTSGPLLQFDMNNSVPAYVGNSTSVAVAGSASMTRGTLTFTTNQATTAFVSPYIVITPGTGKTVDFTLRISVPQMELGAFATSPIITTGAAGTRGVDDAFVSGLTINSATMTFAAEAEFLLQTTNADTALGTVTDTASAGQSLLAAWRATNGEAYFQTRNAGLGTAISYGSTAKSGARLLRMATALNGTAATGAIDNVLVAPATIVTPPGLTRLNIGTGFTAARPANAYIRRLRILPTAATNAQLQALTAP
jgi:hypothetical protein